MGCHLNLAYKGENKMVRNTLSLFDNFNQLTPYAVGFERSFKRLNDYIEHNTQSTGFPPYNIQ